MKTFRIFALSPLLLISILSACTGAAPAEILEPEPKTSSPEATNTPSRFPTQSSPIEQTPTNITLFTQNEHAEKARQDLAQRLGVPVEDITVVTVIGLEFSTDAFYCRKSKERIAKEESLQVISGLSIVLSTSDRKYEYHASDQTVIFCRPLL